MRLMLVHQRLEGYRPLSHKGWTARKVRILWYEREVSATQLPIKTLVVPIGKSDPALGLRTDIIFGGNVGAKINKFLDYIKTMVTCRNLRINTPHISTFDNIYFVFPSFTARPILVDSRSIVLKAAITSRLVRPMMLMSSAYASNWALF